MQKFSLTQLNELISLIFKTYISNHNSINITTTNENNVAVVVNKDLNVIDNNDNNVLSDSNVVDINLNAESEISSEEILEWISKVIFIYVF